MRRLLMSALSFKEVTCAKIAIRCEIILSSSASEILMLSDSCLTDPSTGCDDGIIASISCFFYFPFNFFFSKSEGEGGDRKSVV